MFVHDNFNNATYRYQLTTPFTLSTAQRPYGTFSIYRNAPVAVYNIDRIGAFYMRPDRQKMYTANSARSVYEYTMSVPGDIRTAQNTNTTSLTSSISNANGLNFSPDGRKMFVVDNQASTNTKIVEYSLASPWNITNPGIGFTFNIGRVSGGALYTTSDGDINFNSDGTKFYLGSTGTQAISEWNTKTPWTLEGSVPVFESFYPGNQDTTPANIAWNTDGNRFFILGYTNATVYQYDVPIDHPFDVRYAVYNGISYSVSARDTAPAGLAISPDGTRMYISGVTNDSVYQFTLNSAWSISSVTFVGSFSVASQQATPLNVKLSSDGKLMFIGGFANGSYGQIHQYILNTPWTVSTAYYSNTMYDFYDVGNASYRLSGAFYFDFSADGRRLYAMGRDQNRMQHYDLERPWDITTLRHRGSFYFPTRYQGYRGNIISTTFNGFTFRPDGKAFYIVDDTYDRLYTYYLETPWNIATAYLPGISVFDYVSYPTTFSFSNDGYRLYVLDSNGSLLREYTLKTAWAIHSWIPKDWYDSNYNPSFYAGYNARAIRLMPDGETMYFANNLNIWELKLNNLKKVSINNNTQIAGSLDVKQTIEATGAKINGELTAASIGIGVTSVIPTAQFQVGAASTQMVVVTRNGSVGVGTTNPQALLHVNDNVYISGRLGVGQITPLGRIHITSPGIGASAPANGWPYYDAENDIVSKQIYIDTAGNGSVGTASSGATVSVVLGQYYDSRAIITTVAAGANSPSDQGSGHGKDLLIKGGTSDNNVRNGGRLFLSGGSGFSGGFNANYGNVVIQPFGGNLGIGSTQPTRQLQVHNTTNAIISAKNGIIEGILNATTTNVNVGSASGNFLTISTNGTERLRVTTTGQFIADFTNTTGINTFGHGGYYSLNATSNSTILTDQRASWFLRGSLQSTNDELANCILLLQDTGGAAVNKGDLIKGYSGSTFNFRVANNGGVTNTPGTYGAISDERLKQDIVDAGSQWNDIKQIRVRKFKFIADPDTNPYIGVIAQEIESISPGLVDQALLEDGSPDPNSYKSVKYSILYMKSIKALQEAQERIEILESQVSTLIEKVSKLES
jgi:sugar lactone lactonase YvrE